MITDNIGIIGYGNMGSAIAEQLKARYKIFVFDKDFAKTKNICGIVLTDGAVDLVNKVDVIIIAVKPQDCDELLQEIKNYVNDKLIISIAAGISTSYLEKNLCNKRVVRAMPNIGVRIAESVTCLCKGALADDNDLNFAEELFGYLGVTKRIEENMINSSTAISGSGPAYIFYYIESNSIDPYNIPETIKENIVKRLAKAAECVGFKSEDALFLAVNTSSASIDLIKKTRMEPAKLRKQVTSKGGTTEAALEILSKGGSWEEAAKAAVKRAEELAKKE